MVTPVIVRKEVALKRITLDVLYLKANPFVIVPVAEVAVKLESPLLLHVVTADPDVAMVVGSAASIQIMRPPICRGENGTYEEV
jgi:hypothetical protein